MKKSPRLLPATSFLLPFLLTLAGFALLRVYPFGPFQALIVDLQQQYYPFLVWLRQSILTGTLSPWTWQIGLGASTVPLYAYYLASPLNLLLLLSPEAYLREAIALLTAVRIGLAGLSAFYALRRLTQTTSAQTLAFSLLYALCGFAIGYQSNIIWLDTFALLPVLAVTTVRFFAQKRWGAYPFVLFLSIWCNYFLGFMCCVFVALLYVAVCVAEGAPPRLWLRRLGKLAAGSLVGAGMAAVLLVPSVLALSANGSLLSEGAPSLLLQNPLAVLGNFALLAKPTLLDGLPNVFTGVLGVVGAGLYWTAPAIPRANSQILRDERISPEILTIPRREKYAVTGLLAFLLASCVFGPLDFLWNALHTARDLPARFSFLISFVLVYMGLRGVVAAGGSPKQDKHLATAEPPNAPPQSGRSKNLRFLAAGGRPPLIAMALCGGAVALCALLGPQGWIPALATACATAVYVLLFALRDGGRLPQKAFAGILAGLVCVEIILSLLVSAQVQAADGYLTRRDEFPFQQAGTQAMLDQAKAISQGPRVEISREPNVFNLSALFGYRGATSFSSVLNTDTADFMERIGLPASAPGIRTTYAEGSPFSAALLGIGAYVARDGYMADRNEFWTLADTDWSVSLYENRYPLGLGFVIGQDALAFTGTEKNPFASQNELFTQATGIEAPLFEEVTGLVPIDTGYALTETGEATYSFARTGHAGPENAVLRWEMDAPTDGIYYLYINSDATRNGRYGMGLIERAQDISLPYIRCIGAFEQGDPLFVEGFLDGKDQEAASITVRMAVIDPEAFRAGYGVLAENQLDVTVMDGPRVEGFIAMDAPGLLYTSIPYEPGWTAQVDGEAAEILPIGGAMAGVMLDAGPHTVRFAYQTPGLYTGLMVSLAAAVCYLFMLVVRRRAKDIAP